jgi:CBS domain-containing protein
VTKEDRMVDVLSNFSDGNLHRIFVCDKSGKDGLPRPVAAITQRDLMRILLIFLGQTLQGEVRIAVA